MRRGSVRALGLAEVAFARDPVLSFADGVAKVISGADPKHPSLLESLQRDDTSVLDLVRDHDGPIARSLRELISVGFELEQFRPAFLELESFFVKHVILTRAVLDHNISAQHRADGSWRMVVIDGLGDPAFLPVARWIPALGRAKMHRRFAQAWPRFEKLTTNKVTQELIEKSTWGQGFLNHRG